MIRRAVRILTSLARTENKTRWVANKIAWRLFDGRLQRQHLVNQAFDRRHGTETAGEIPLAQTGVPEDQANRGNGIYRTFWESDFHKALAALKTGFDGFTFVDIGSGKGKLLLLASGYPFARIIGVEYSPGLHAIAQSNIARYHSSSQRCLALEAVRGDALQYRLPDGPIVCFIFNAFDASTLREVLRSIENDFCSRSTCAYVIYANLRSVAEMAEGLDATKRLPRLRSTRRFVIFGNAAAYRQYATDG